MPQPLNELGTDVSLAITPDTGPPQRPALAILAMQAIAEGSRLDAEVGNVFVELSGANPRPASVTYLSLNGSIARQRRSMPSLNWC